MPGRPSPLSRVRRRLLEPIIDQNRQHADRMVGLLERNDVQAALAATRDHAREQEVALDLLSDYEELRDNALGAMPADDRLARLLEGTRTLLGAHVAAVLLLDEEGDELWPVATSGFHTSLSVRPTAVNGSTRRLVKSGEPMVIHAATPEDEFRAGLLREGIQSIVGVPIRLGGQVEGALACGHRGKAHFSQKDVDLLGLVADRMGAGLERRRAAEHEVRRREDAEAASRFKSDLLQMATHDVKTPLTAISLQLHMLGQPGVADEHRAKAVATVQRNLHRLHAMLDEFLDLARAEAGGFTIQPTTLDVGRLLEDAAELFGPQAAERGLRLQVQAAEGLKARGDPRRICQVLSNLVSNAIHYSDQGTVTLEAKQGPEFVEIRVRDEGVGLTGEQAGRLFQPFAQVHGSSRAGGTGLGLYLSKAIVSAHGGDLRAESPGPGKGSVFAFTLPCLEAGRQ